MKKKPLPKSRVSAAPQQVETRTFSPGVLVTFVEDVKLGTRTLAKGESGFVLSHPTGRSWGLELLTKLGIVTVYTNSVTL